MGFTNITPPLLAYSIPSALSLKLIGYRLWELQLHLACFAAVVRGVEPVIARQQCRMDTNCGDWLCIAAFSLVTFLALLQPCSDPHQWVHSWEAALGHPKPTLLFLVNRCVWEKLLEENQANKGSLGRLRLWVRSQCKLGWWEWCVTFFFSSHSYYPATSLYSCYCQL